MASIRREGASVLVVGLLCALVAAGLNSAAGLLEAAGGRRVHRAGGVVSQPLYLLGLAVDVIGFLLTVVALRFLAVFAVQAVLASSIAITVLVGHRLYRTPLRTADKVATVACVAGLAVVAASAGGGEPAAVPDAAGPILLLAALALGAATVPVWRSRNAVAAAVLAGLAFGGVALAVRAVHLRTTLAADLATLPWAPAAYAVVAFAVVGIVAYTRALARGAVATVTGVLVVTEAVVPGLIGMVLLGDMVRSGWQLPLALGLLVAVGGVVALVRSPVRRGLTAPTRLGKRPRVR